MRIPAMLMPSIMQIALAFSKGGVAGISTRDTVRSIVQLKSIGICLCYSAKCLLRCYSAK
jgi:hypothetical protein